MLSLPDFRQKQIVYIQSEWGTRCKLRLWNDNIVFEKNGQVVNRTSIHRAFAVFVLGDLSLTTQFIRKCKDHGVSLFLLKYNFGSYASLATTAEGHYLLRMKQYALTEPEQLTMAKKLIQNKIINQLNTVKKKTKREEKKLLEEAISSISQQIKQADSSEKLLGIEGNTSSLYFWQLFKDLGWLRRAPRTKEDIPNLLLDIGYTFLFNMVDSLLRLHGFDTYKGFYHKLFFQRKSLACDLVEPFRHLIDKDLVKAYNLGQINEKDFRFENGSFSLEYVKHKKYAAIFFTGLMNHKEDLFKYVHQYYRHIMNPEEHPFPEYIGY